MSNETQTVETSGTGLAIAPDQTAFTPVQVAALSHIGIEDAPAADLAVFFHVCKRMRLDPYARQVYMIKRMETVKDNDGNDRKRPKWVIQTGIDGFRAVGHREAERKNITVGTLPVEWCDDNGMWRGAWKNAWGYPLAARFTVVRNGQEFTATANFDDYVGGYWSNGDAKLMGLWKSRYAGQLAKCAEAMAWRMAFPQDLFGAYIQEEMDRHDFEPEVEAEVGSTLKVKSLDKVKSAVKSRQRPRESNDVLQGETVARKIDADQRRQLAAGFTPEAGFDADPTSAEGRADAIRFIVDTLTDKTTGVAPDVKSTADLDEAQLGIVLQAVEDRRRAVAAAPVSGEVDEQDPPYVNFGGPPSGDDS